MPFGEPEDFIEQSRHVADLTAAFIDTLIADGWDERAVMAGVHSGAVARIVSRVGIETAAAASEQTADELRGAYHA